MTGSNVWLIGSHHNHEREGVHDGRIVFPEGKMDKDIVEQMGWVALTEEMLGWTFWGPDRTIEITDSMDNEDKPWRSQLTACLQAMLATKSMTFLVSLSADQKNERICRERRDWAWLYQADTGEYLFSFTHHTKKYNCPFGYTLDWVQEDNEPKDPAPFKEFLQGWCSPARWQALFFQRIEETLTGEIRELNGEIDKLAASKDALSARLQFTLANRVAWERTEALR